MAQYVANPEAPETTLSRSVRPWLLSSFAALGLVLGAATAIVALSSSFLIRAGLQAVLINWIMIAFLGAGLIAWWRRPESRLGPLLVATGLVSATAALQWSDDPYLFSIGHVLDMLPAALYLHLFLAFPSGRLDRGRDLIVVVVGYVAAFGLQVLKILLGDIPDNALTVILRPQVASVIEKVQLGTMSALMLAGVAILISRRRTPGRVSRRPAAITVDAFALAMVMLAVLYVAGMLQWPAFEIIRHVTFLTLGLAPAAFLIGVLDARLARADVGTMLVHLRAGADGDVDAAVAGALRDPSARVAYWLPHFDRWTDQAGREVDLPGPGERVTQLIARGGEPLGMLIADPSLADEGELVAAVAATVGIAVENTRLQADLSVQLAELTRSRRRLLDAGRRERARLERDLQDGALRRLTAVTSELARLGEETADPSLRDGAGALLRDAQDSVDELREVARGLYPFMLERDGLGAALVQLAARSAVPARTTVEVVEPLPEPVAVALYFVVSESLTNVAKHARAESVSVTVTETSETPGSVRVEVVDDGIGGADVTAGSGLRGLTDRVETLGGSLGISSPAGGGTRLVALVPCGR